MMAPCRPGRWRAGECPQGRRLRRWRSDRREPPQPSLASLRDSAPAKHPVGGDVGVDDRSDPRVHSLRAQDPRAVSSMVSTHPFTATLPSLASMPTASRSGPKVAAACARKSRLCGLRADDDASHSAWPAPASMVKPHHAFLRRVHRDRDGGGDGADHFQIAALSSKEAVEINQNESVGTSGLHCLAMGHGIGCCRWSCERLLRVPADKPDIHQVNGGI